MKVSANGASRKDWAKRRAYEKAYRESTKTKQAVTKRKWYELNREHVIKRTRRSAIKRLFGIDQAEVDRMFVEQNGACVICGNWLDQGRNTHIDHNHVSGKVRGLLCGLCNKGLGLFKDSPDLLELASKYLRDRG